MVFVNWIVLGGHLMSADPDHSEEVSCDMSVPLDHLCKSHCRETNSKKTQLILYTNVLNENTLFSYSTYSM